MTDDPWAAFRGPKETSDDPWASFRSKPTNTAEQQTNKLSTTEKFAKGAISGTIGGFENFTSLLDKAGVADKDKISVLRDVAAGARGMFGVTPQEYKPAGDTAWDSNKPFLERAAEAPRAMVEGAAPLALASMAGPIAAGLTVGATQTAPTIDRVRAADHTDPNADLTLGQKARVAGNVGLQMALGGLGSKLTFGGNTVRGVGMEGVKNAGKQLANTAMADAAIGGAGAAADKAIVDQQSPTLSDVAVGSIAGAAGGAFGGAKRAAKEAAVATRFRALGDIDPQSRGEVADILKNYEGNFGVSAKHINDDLSLASKGLDELTKKTIAEAKLEIEAGKRVDPAKIEAVSKVSPDAGRALRNADTLGLMRGYENSSLANSTSGINPFENWKTRWGDLWLGHLLGPKAAIAAAGLQTAAAGGARVVDRITGQSNPAKVITDKFAGTAEPILSIAQGRAAASSKDLAERQANAFASKMKLDVAKDEKATLDQKAAELDAAKKQAKDDAKATAAAMRIAKDSLKEVRDRDAIKERYNQQIVSDFQKKANDSLGLLDDLEQSDRKATADKQKADDAAMRRQADLMRNSQADEQRRLTAEARVTKKADKKFWANQRSRLDLRTRSDISVSEAAGRNLGDSQNVPLPELVSSDVSKSIRTQAGVQRILSKADKDYWAAQRDYLALRNKSDVPASEYMGQDLGESQNVPLPGLVSTSAALPLALSRMKNPNAAKELRSSFQDKEEATQAGDANSSPLSARPDEVKNVMALNKVKKKAEQKQERKSSEDTKASIVSAQAKADKRVSEARKEARQSAQEADPNYYTYKKHGVTERFHKDSIHTDQARHQQSWEERQDTRKVFLDDAADLLSGKMDEKALGRMMNSWSKARNNPDKARRLWTEYVDKAAVSKDTKIALIEGFDDIAWTWE
jgi:hypothetical protein